MQHPRRAAQPQLPVHLAGPRGAGPRAGRRRIRRRPRRPDRRRPTEPVCRLGGVRRRRLPATHGGHHRRHRARGGDAGLARARAGLGAVGGATCAEGRRRLPRLRLPSERQWAAAHRDQHQCRRRPAQCRAGAGAEGLLRGGLRRAARRASCRHRRAGLCRHVPRGVARGKGRSPPRAHRHRRRAAQRAVPLPGIPAVPEALRAARHGGDDLRSGRVALRGWRIAARG